jgi:hypothetical protein
MKKNTLLIGASENPERYSYKAIVSLKKHEHPVTALGIKEGAIGETKFITNKPQLTNIDTVTLYINPKNQIEWMDYILSLNPKRIIFNPGTENLEFNKIASAKGIDCVEACTLVMLSIGNY